MGRYHVTVGERELTISVADDGTVLLDGQADPIDILAKGDSAYSVRVGGVVVPVVLSGSHGSYEALVRGVPTPVRVESDRDRLLRGLARKSGMAAGRSELRAPMPALVVRIGVNVGDDVQAGKGVVVLEAMKMENELRVSHAGKVKEILVAPGKAVEKGELLLVLDHV